MSTQRGCVTAFPHERNRVAPPETAHVRGYGRLYVDHVMQAPDGCDFEFLGGRDPVEATTQPKF